jgi:hypothetical protein
MRITPSASDWDQAKEFYSRLTLRRDGDSLEKEAMDAYGFDACFPNYEKFWKFHIAPATNRPVDDRIRDDAHKAISFVIQRQYSILYCLVIASGYGRRVATGDLGGEGRRNAFNAIIYAGNALQAFDSLQKSVESLRVASRHWGRRDFLFPDWWANWGKRRIRLCTYRNYLIHDGVLHTEYRSGPGQQQIPHVRRVGENQEELEEFTWTEDRDDFKRHPDNWISLVELCSDTVSTTIQWMNDIYGVIISRLDPLLQLPEYRALWGWSPTTLQSLVHAQQKQPAP